MTKSFLLVFIFLPRLPYVPVKYFFFVPHVCPMTPLQEPSLLTAAGVNNTFNAA